MNFSSSLRIASDYNRALPAPVRWVHVLFAVVTWPFEPGLRWLYAPPRRWLTVPLTWAVGLTLLLLPLDGPISRTLGSVRLGGDIRREVEAWQQFGALGSLLFVGAVIWLLDEKNRRQLLNLVAAVVSVGVAINLLKMLVGRPRPEFDDPGSFLGPFGVYPVSETAGVRHAWEFWGGISSDLWSMPSSHTAYAVVLSVFLFGLYPRLFPLLLFMTAFVGFARVLRVAHYPTDVVVGALVAYPLARKAVISQWGIRVAERWASRRRPAGAVVQVPPAAPSPESNADPIGIGPS